MPTPYQAIARRARPQTFAEVLGQEPICKALQHAHSKERLHHAYLFSGPQGTGKTTLARLLAKLINCDNPTNEPCNDCSSCHEIAHSTSLDVIEIDGASNRGIDDIRQINETVAFAATKERTRIYIIDEVHMLTKEAFNALLKTLEEPPPKVKFFFATTEPQRVPPTIISRCQRFALRRLSDETIISKLKSFSDLPEADLALIARTAEGGMRDAESLLEQAMAYEGPIHEILGLAPLPLFDKLDQAILSNNLDAAFEISAEVYNSGIDINQFLTDLLYHYRSHLLKGSFDKTLTLTLLDDLLQLQSTMRQIPSKRLFLEMALTRVIRLNQRVPLEKIVERLEGIQTAPKKATPPPAPKPAPKKTTKPSNTQRHETILRFAGVELEGSVTRKK